MGKVVVVGEAPSRWMSERKITDPLPLAGRELAKLAGIRWPDQWFELFEPVNVLGAWPGRAANGKNDLFPMELAKPAAWKLADSFQGRRVILLGRRVEMAFGLQLPWFQWWREWEFCHSDLTRSVIASVAVSPHPSSANRWWNKPENRAQAANFWMSVAEGQGVQ